MGDLGRAVPDDLLLFAHLRRFELVGERGQRARLLDVRVDLSTGDYPTVTHLRARVASSIVALPWSAVERIDWARRRLHVGRLEAGETVADDALAHAVLLRRDVLDALVLDLQNLRATRINDLWLRHLDGQLRLAAADVSPWAILVRLTRGRLPHPHPRDLIDWKHVEFLRGDPQAARAGNDYHRRVAHLPPGQIASLMDALPYPHAAELLTLLPDPIAADALQVMAPERQLQVFEALEPEQAVRLLALLAPEVGADLVGLLQPARAKRYLEQLPPGPLARLVDLLRYPEDTAGGLMTNDVLIVPGWLTIGEARVALRQRLQEPDFIYYIYVVDDLVRRRLLGVLSLRELLVADESAILEATARPPVLTLDPLAPADQAARRVTESHLPALPVVDRDGRLLGAITVDAAVSRIAPLAWRAQAPRVFS